MTFLPTSFSKALLHFVIPNTSTFHKLPQHRSSQWSVVLQEQSTPVLVPCRLKFLPATSSCMCSSAQASSSMDPSWAANSFRASPPAPVWSPPRLLCWYLLHNSHHVLQGDKSFSLIFSSGCRGISAPVHGIPPAPPTTLTLVSAA